MIFTKMPKMNNKMKYVFKMIRHRFRFLLVISMLTPALVYLTGIIYSSESNELVLNESSVDDLEYSFRIETYGPKSQINEITVVSSYFRLNKSKHNTSSYQKWISNLFKSVSSPLVVFTDGNSIDEQLILSLRPNYPTMLYVVHSHLSILKQIEVKRKKAYTFNYKFKQNQLDPGKTK